VVVGTVFKESVKYALRSRPMIRSEVSFVGRMYECSADELHAYKTRRFLDVFRRAYRHSSFYSELYGREGIEEADITSLDHLSMLPVVTKEMVRHNSQKMLTVPEWRMVKASTSGTTGTPLTMFHSYDAIKMEQAYNWQRRMLCGFRFGEKLLSLRGHLGVRRLSAHAGLINTLFLSSYLIGSDRAKEYLDLVRSFRAKAIEGYPSSLYGLALLFRELGQSVEIPACFTSSETLLPFQRSLIEEVFQTRIYDYYGCTERVVALSQIGDSPFYNEDPGYSLCEFREDCLIATGLINSAFPLIKYKVDDVVVKDAEGRIVGIQGRAEDVVLCRDGTRLGRLDHIFKGVDGIDLAQIVQRVAGDVDINVVLSANTDDHVFDTILRNVRERANESNLSVNIKAIRPDEIIYTSRGKFSLVKSFL
jgi:phenylacetate-CoA ligase